MLRIKLLKAGRTESHTYRIIVQPDREKLNGSVVDTIGNITGIKLDQVKIDRTKLEYWLKNGALPTSSAAKVLGLSKVRK